MVSILYMWMFSHDDDARLIQLKSFCFTKFFECDNNHFVFVVTVSNSKTGLFLSYISVRKRKSDI